MHHNGLSGMYLGFEVCQIQWHRFQVSTISNSWKIKISGKNFTFCWFWLGKMHHNGLSGMYLGFEVCQMAQDSISTISGNSQNIKISGKIFTFLLILTGKNASQWLEWYVFRVWGVPNPMAQDSSISISGSWKIKISGKNFTFCWFWLGKMHQNGLSGAYLGFETCQIQWHLFQVSTISGLKNQNVRRQ